MASMGHVRDLPKSKMGIDVEHDFAPTYLIPVEKKKLIKDLKSKIKPDTVVWIATDLDREGEAIGWHLLEALQLKENKIHRIVFHEITKTAILEAVSHPGDLNYDLINAQQSRRLLDRLVGYELSPLLWKKVRYGLSAGRVQSVAVRLIVDRERERDAFVSEEYWSIEGEFFPTKDKKAVFTAKLHKHKDKVIKISEEKEAHRVLELLKSQDYSVSEVERKEVKKNPSPPFITSTLQQEAARKLRMSVKKTMIVAQQLYEGIDMGDGDHQGLITYMRTDSLNLSTQATTAIKKLIKDEYGADYALETPRLFKGKKGAQEAHEAIRPVDVTLKPSAVKQYLDKDQYRLYELIWKRAIACQMQPAVFDRLTLDISTSKEDYLFRATGQTLKFPGFIALYVEGVDDPEEEKENDESLLPSLDKGQALGVKTITPFQHFTQPPARYTEASLVKKLEAEGIGRPSTYAPTISTVMNRGYVEKKEGALWPTDTGMVVTDFLVNHFSTIVDLGFTAKMEEDLDNIAEGKEDWHKFLSQFYGPFHANVDEKMETLKKEDVITETTDEVCDQCGSPMMIKLGRLGKFLSCSNYPACKNAKPLEADPAAEAALAELQKKLGGKKCADCGKPMEVKRGRYGEFLGCTGYPECKNMESIVKFTGVKCPDCNEGQLIERRTKKGGKIFYGCNKFPKCKFATWDKPLDQKCKACEGLMVEKGGKEVCSKCKTEA